MKELTDIVSTYWTVIVESETDNIAAFFTKLCSATMGNELKDIMKRYGLRSRWPPGNFYDRIKKAIRR